MRKFLRAVPWWPQRAQPSAPFASYEVTCACGRAASGQRQTTHQIISCAACGQPLFVLPSSPWQEPVRGISGARNGHALPAAASGKRSPLTFLGPWRWPVLAGSATLTVVIVLFVLLFSALRQRPPATTPVDRDAILAHVRAGQKALASGNFQLATGELDRAVALVRQSPEALPASEFRQTQQLQRQAELLQDLLSESLGEILQSASGLPEEEWEARFAKRYQGRAIVFDADVTQEGGQFQLDYQLQAGKEKEPARIDLGGLKLLTLLPRERPARLLFGARLASMSREPGGTWVVRFEPGSGVLLTDGGAVAACEPPPLDEELQALLKRQEEWVSGMP